MGTRRMGTGMGEGGGYRSEWGWIVRLVRGGVVLSMVYGVRDGRWTDEYKIIRRFISCVKHLSEH